jgi:hypothetical protein
MKAYNALLALSGRKPKLDAALAVEIQWAARPPIVKKRKSFPRSAKPTCWVGANAHTGKGLEVACQMLVWGTDEVARNGAFGEHFGQR